MYGYCLGSSNSSHYTDLRVAASVYSLSSFPNRNSIRIWLVNTITVSSVNASPLINKDDCMMHRYYVLGLHKVEGYSVNQHLKKRKGKLLSAAVDKRTPVKERSNSNIPDTARRCDFCNKDCANPSVVG